jgi:prepilin peptidase CpaA
MFVRPVAMTFTIPAMILAAALALMMVAAAISDLRKRDISNGLNLAMAALAIPYWLAIGLSPWPDIAMRVGFAAVVFLVFLGLYMIGGMGGGDVKMVGAVMLWVPPLVVTPMLMVMSIAGIAISLAMLIHKIWRGATEPPEVPYGVAIAAAGLWMLHQQYLNQFTFIPSV